MENVDTKLTEKNQKSNVWRPRLRLTRPNNFSKATN